MGTVMPPATEAVMSVVPRERAGSGSALTNTARQVAGALGVAVLGSILAQAYRGQLSPHLTGLPAAARDAAAGSITATQAVAAKLGRRRAGPGRLRRHRLRARDARHHDHLRGDHPGWARWSC